ncbi:glycosyltransferase [Pseudomaricurvus alkylphenolicus]|uniref:glycosyltransferase family 4 protein n=1 Tax=Pseudomaricurvus alkylphenolicus TaxID=1306991 RepID=UPI00141D8F42|nr:glycosyltransferase [Pseudomaricurvus alkylphenolicus]NIB42103.1 glycosyltransferase [Pseudomaricurvus alkylphenolicus]
MSTLPAIHQFSLSCSPGDGITNGMFLIQRLLQAAGIESEIYCEEIHPSLADRVWHRLDYQGAAQQVLLIHHGIGNGFEAWLRALPDRCFMVFHNITPARFFAEDDPIQPMLEQGWQQLDSWADWLEGAIADSRTNREILEAHGYDPLHCKDIPLLVDLQQFQTTVAADSFRPLEDECALLFVGRLMKHKNQHGLIETLHHLRQMSGLNARLTLVGSTDDSAYVEKLDRQIDRLGLHNHVRITGKVPAGELNAEFQKADLYVSLSHHEGFGMPLVESMAQRLPVLAYSAPDSNVHHTIGAAGMVLDKDDPKLCAATIEALMQSPRLRAAITKAGSERLQAFEPVRLYEELAEFLQRFNIQLPATPSSLALDAPAGQLQYLIEGPFDSSYSLAIVNRELARALNRRHPGKVALRSSEGHGDFEPDADFLQHNPDCAAMFRLARVGQSRQNAKTHLRLLYPPRAQGLKGDVNGMGAYGWEESVLPWDVVNGFNRHLQFVSTMSHYVSRTLIDNGVTTPIHTIGIGADHILATEPCDAQLPELGQGLCFLHISSCFPRKGVDCLLGSYGRAFNDADDVTLIIKTFPNPHHRIEEQLQTWRQSVFQKRGQQAPRVILINQDLDDAAIRALYQRANVLVAPSRGEGFGLPMAEAMLHDLPVITTAYGGQADFCKDDTAWLIDYQFARANTHMDQSASVWVNPDVEHLAQLLGEFYRQHQSGKLREFTAARVQKARALIEREYTWDAVAERLDLTMQQAPAPLLDAELAFGSLTTWNSKCGIATYSKLLLQPALSNTWIFANRDAELTETDGERVLRCWESGSDDDLTQVANAVQEAGVRQLLIQFNFSFFRLSHLRQLLRTLYQGGVQVLLTFHSTADVIEGEVTKSLRDILPELKQATRLLVHGTDDLNRLKSYGLVDNVTLFPHGVALPSKKPPAPPQSIREHFNRVHQSGRKRVIASYGFLLPHKGVRQLIEAFAELSCTRDDLHLLLMNACYPVDASEKEAAECRALISRLGLESEVTMVTDFLPDHESLAWLTEADVIVFPYQHTQESSSAAVRWGLGAGKPVMCTPLPIFEDVAEAVRFLPGTESAELMAGLDQWLQERFNDKEQLQRQQVWLQQHDWQRLSKRLKSMLTALYLYSAEGSLPR